MKKMMYKNPGSLLEACKILSEHAGTCILIAGGTDLLIEMRQNRIKPDAKILVNTRSLEELDYIREDNEYVYIGAGTTHASLSRSAVIRGCAGFLGDAAASVGSPQTRNMGTVGGNIITAAQCADTIPPLLVLDAELKLAHLGGDRVVPLGDFFKGPKTTDIKPDEILVEIKFRKPDPLGKGVFEKLIRRAAVAKARINFSAFAVQDTDGKIIDIRISPGSVTPVHMRFTQAEEMLTGQIPDKALISKAAEKISQTMVKVTGRRWSTPFKEPVLKTMAERGLAKILEVSND